MTKMELKFLVLVVLILVNTCVANKERNVGVEHNFGNDFTIPHKFLPLEYLIDEHDNQLTENAQTYFVKGGRSLAYEFYSSWKNISKNLSTREVNSKCFNQIGALVAGLATNDLTSFKYFDSWGKIPAGLLKGHTTELGNWDECISIKKSLTDQSHLNGKYCLAKIPFAPAQGLIKIRVGICMPAACSAKEFDVFFKLVLKSLLSISLSDETSVVDETSCSTAEKEPFDGWDWLAICVLSILGCAMLFSSVYEYLAKMNGKQPSPVLSSFSIPSNLSQLLRIQPNTKNRNIITCLNGIRCLSTLWVVYGHTFAMMGFLPNINTLDLLPWSKTATSMLIQYAAFSVDTFFFISGFLLAFLALRDMDRTRGKLNIPMMYVQRIIRLTPMVALAVLYYGTLYRHMGSGPLWPTAAKWHDNCCDNWWSTILYVQNYANVKEMCIGHTWYLAVDMQLYIISPIFLFAVWKYKGKGVAFVSLIALLFLGCAFTSTIVNEFTFHTKGVYNPGEMEMIRAYFVSHPRTGPWFVGFMFGYFLHTVRQTRAKLSKFAVLLGWLVCFTLIAAILFSFLPKAQNREDVTTLEEAFYWPFARIGWALALCWIVFACVNDYGGPINSFLSCPLWQPFTKLSYCIYLWHIVFVELNVGRTRTSHYFSNYDLTLQLWSNLGWVLLFSTGMYLAFEAPLVNLQNIFLPKPNRVKPPIITISQEHLTEEKVEFPVSQTDIDELKKKTADVEANAKVHTELNENNLNNAN